MLFGPYDFNETLSLAGPIDASDLPELKRLGFTTIVNNRPDGESPRQMTSAELRRVVVAAGFGFVDIPFKGAKLTAAQVDAFLGVLSRPGRILAVCATGTRCAMIAVAAEIRRGMDTDAALALAKGAGFDLAPMQGFLASFAGKTAA